MKREKKLWYINKYLLKYQFVKFVLGHVIFTIGMKVVFGISEAEHVTLFPSFFFLNQSHRLCILNNRFKGNTYIV